MVRTLRAYRCAASWTVMHLAITKSKKKNSTSGSHRPSPRKRHNGRATSIGVHVLKGVRPPRLDRVALEGAELTGGPVPAASPLSTAGLLAVVAKEPKTCALLGPTCLALQHLGNTCQELGAECEQEPQLPQPRHDCLSHGMWLRASKSSAMGVLTGS